MVFPPARHGRRMQPASREKPALSTTRLGPHTPPMTGKSLLRFVQMRLIRLAARNISATLLACTLALTIPAVASPLDGDWLTQDRDGVMRVYDCGPALCIEIAGVFLDRPGDPMPTDWKGTSQCHLRLVTDAKQVAPNLWKGHILDPRDGTIYGAEISETKAGDLALRGYLGTPLLGQTQTWTPYHGPVPPNCRIAPNESTSIRAFHPA